MDREYDEKLTSTVLHESLRKYRKQRYKRLTRAEQDKICQLYSSGTLITTICSKFSISRTTVHRIWHPPCSTARTRVCNASGLTPNWPPIRLIAPLRPVGSAGASNATRVARSRNSNEYLRWPDVPNLQSGLRHSPQYTGRNNHPSRRSQYFRARCSAGRLARF
ncbi:helix-turn-helix domain-containing protein [Kytococcus sedentarius]|uniref:helix-turn-helix domain-containing protein n=1 Tax=Kytococcus sedentarius TaxID=1276 RepID=UPI0018732666